MSQARIGKTVKYLTPFYLEAGMTQVTPNYENKLNNSFPIKLDAH